MSVVRLISTPARSRSIASAARVRSLAPGPSIDFGGDGMYVGSDFSPSGAGEVERYSFNFSALLATGETISSCVFTAAVDSGAGDGSVGSRIIGASTIASPIASQLAGNFLPGVTYRLYSTAVTSAGQTLVLWSRIYCPTI